MFQTSLPAVGSAVLPSDIRTFADLIEKISAVPDLKPSRRRDLVSALRRVAAAIDLAPEQVPSHLPWLRPRLADLTPQRLGLAPKTWSTLLSNCQAAITLADRKKVRVERRKSLSEDWRKLWIMLADGEHRQLAFGLSSFVFFLNRSGIAPDMVNDAHALAFREELTASRIRKDPESTYRKAVQTWNRARLRLPLWPQQQLTAPSRRRAYRLDLAAPPESFSTDLDQFLTRLAHPDPFDDETDLRPLQPTTIKAHRDRLLQFAGALVAAGLPIDQLTSLATLVDPNHARKGLTHLLAQNNNTVTTGLSMITETLWTIARRHVRPPNAEMDELKKWRDRIRNRRPRQRGMTEKNLERLRPLRDTTTMARFLRLPEDLFARGIALGKTPKGLLLQRDAIMLAILRNHPIRRKNLLGLRIDTHFDRSGIGPTYLVIAGKDVKNRRSIEFEVDPALMGMIEQHIALRVAAGDDPECPWLFPSAAHDRSLSPSYVSTRLTNIITRELGLAFNIHLSRHLAAYLFLGKMPGHYEAVRRLLAHSSTSVTLDAYAAFETDNVGRIYGGFLADALSKAKNKGG